MKGIAGTPGRVIRKVNHLWKGRRLKYHSGPIKKIARLAQQESSRLYIASIKDFSFHLLIRCAQIALFSGESYVLTQSMINLIIRAMTEKEIVLENYLRLAGRLFARGDRRAN
jgi:hypothetical protein